MLIRLNQPARMPAKDERNYQMNNNFTIDDIKKIRELTGVGLTDAKKALQENSSFEKALQAMRKKGLAKVAQRSEKVARSGIIHSYIHDGRIGVLIEVNCETDFVAKNEDFLNFVRDLALQIAATNPFCLKEGNPESKEARNQQAEQSLLGQSFIKNPELTVNDLLQSQIAKLGENIVIARFVRFELGDLATRLISGATEE